MTTPRQAERPVVRAPAFDNIPAEMREAKRWAVWRFEPTQGPEAGELKWEKIPYRSLNIARCASSTDPRTWSYPAQARNTMSAKPVTCLALVPHFCLPDVPT